MPKYYCDYCGIYLTHNTLRVRRDHNRGWKHAANVRAHLLRKSKDLEIQLEGIYLLYHESGHIPPLPPGHMIYNLKKDR